MMLKCVTNCDWFTKIIQGLKGMQGRHGDNGERGDEGLKVCSNNLICSI